MYRLDKACELSTFTNCESSRYALSAVRFRPPARSEILPIYQELRKPHYDKRSGTVRQMTSNEAFKAACSQLRGSVEATNGRLLVRVPTLNGDEFPVTPGAKSEPRECLIPAAALKAVVRQIPKVKGKPVLESARLTMDGDKVIFSTTDYDRSTDSATRQHDGRFPDTDSVWPKEPIEMEMAFTAGLLESIVRHAKQHSEDGIIRMALRSPESAAEFSYQLSDDRTARAILMPCAIAE